MKLFLKYSKPFAPYVCLGLFIKILGSLSELVIPFILEHIIDVVVPTSDMRAVLFWGVAMIVVSLLTLVLNVVANRMAAKVARNVTEGVRHDLFRRVMYLTAAQIDKLTVPSLESRLTSDTFQIHRVTGMILRMGIRAPILLIGGVLVTLALDPVMTLVMLGTLPLIAVSVLIVSRKGIKLFTGVQDKVDSMTGVVRENATGIRVVKALSKTDYEKRHFDGSNRELVAAEKRAQLTMALSNPLITFFLNAGLAAVIVVGAYRVQGELTKPGVIIAFMSYFTIIANAMIAITRIFTMMTRGIASANRITEVIELKQELTPVENTKKCPREGYIVFDHVDFSYGKMKKTLTDIDFSLPKGGTLGIIGATGSGKSTVIQLLMRYYDADSGAVYLDGRDVRSYTADELYSKIGIVRQNDFIYNDTIEENISFGRDLPHEDIEKAAVIAQAHGFISDIEAGYDHQLTSKGTNVSGGQRQRLLISRALAGNPELLILDDSSSALDYKTDANLRRAISENLGDTTQVIVAQRVSSIMGSDLILVMDEGEIVAAGTHEQLIESCEVYREISDSQLGGAFLE
ncbi:MAG: ABC transporter ATP-binding protein [Clostridia bacterium]|nr:ABC transporter ATP-binding protein [Clostridia bacterium]